MPDTIRFRFSTGFELCVATGEFEEFCAEEEDGELTWTNAILDNLIHRLEELATLSEMGQVDVTPYADCVDGTRNLWLDLLDHGVPVRYAVGIVIFHQLLYCTPLTAVRQG